MQELICASLQGYSHIENHRPCEDWGVAVSGEYGKIFVTADGHGDSNCPRSRFGAKTICDVAVECLGKFAKCLHREQMEEKLILPGRKQSELLRHLISNMVVTWKKTVSRDFETHPLTDEEKKGCSRYLAEYDQGLQIPHIYGTTVIAGLLTEKYLLLLQQGDGQCVLFDQDGQALQPIPWDNRCFANVTTSVCDEDAIESFRSCVLDIQNHPPAACFAGSDGVDDSFGSSERMHCYYRELIEYGCTKGVENLNFWLEENLPEFSRTGSRDDVTITGFMDPSLCEKLIPGMQRDSHRVILREQEEMLTERIRSMNAMGRIKALEEKMKQLQTAIGDHREKLLADQKQYEEFLLQYEILQEKKNQNPEIFMSFQKLFSRLLPEEPFLQAQRRQKTMKENLESQKESEIHLEEKYKETEKEYARQMQRKQEYEAALEKIRQELSRISG